MTLVSKLDAALQRFSFSHWGQVTLERPLSLDLYEAWLEQGHHADMAYLERHLPIKEDSRKLAPQARSAIVVARSYYPHPFTEESPTPSLRTALYAKGGDYHRHFKAELEALASALKVDFVNEEFLCFTDSAPVLERDLAYRAGLGWFGKNTCLIHPEKGSLFFIGEIFTSLQFTEQHLRVADFCGSCDRCIRACPTGALVAPKVLDARKCISYWTIEAREAAPEALRANFGDWFFGCDICQTVCPWNEKNLGRAEMRALVEPNKTDPTVDLRWILTSSNRELQRAFAKLPVLRARPRGLKRNALLVIANLNLVELLPEVTALLEDKEHGTLAKWAKDQLENNHPQAPQSPPQ